MLFRSARLRNRRQYGKPIGVADLEARMQAAIADATALDSEIAPLARASTALGNSTWGLLMRAGSDKSLFARQVEKYADIYTSRVSNLLAETPFGYLRAARGSLPHDRDS